MKISIGGILWWDIRVAWFPNKSNRPYIRQ